MLDARSGDGAALRAHVVNARIRLGIHFRTAGPAGRPLRPSVADRASRHCFRPTGRHG